MSPASGSLRLLDRPSLDAARGKEGAFPIRTARIRARSVTELHISAGPDADSGDFARQASSIYEGLLGELRSNGGSARDIVAEKIFFSDLRSQIRALRAIRRDFYEEGMTDGRAYPATTFIQQPPARPGRLCEVQVFALLPSGRGAFVSRPMEGLPAGASGRVIEPADGPHEVFLSGLTGGNRCDGFDFHRQASSAFRRAEECLHDEGLSFLNVVRTWIYLSEIDRDYAALNRARREFFSSRGVRVSPASTGIRGSLHPPDRICGLDLRAVGSKGKAGVRAIHAPTLNEAPSYGSDFSRGMRVDLPDRSVIYLSGTASIDSEGRVVHPGEIEGQVDRMLLNVEQLLAGQGAAYRDVVSAVTYLKRADDLGAFGRVAERRGFHAAIPNTIVVADVCRPEWLCEIEAIAVRA